MILTDKSKPIHQLKIIIIFENWFLSQNKPLVKKFFVSWELYRVLPVISHNAIGEKDENNMVGNEGII